MDIIDESKATIQSLNHEWFQHKIFQIDMLRLDLIHPIISGNKWYKLKHNLQYAIENGYKNILTFGGGYSNHLIATAAVARQFNITSIGIVRGLNAKNHYTETLLRCKELGMELEFISKEDYAKKDNENWLQELKQKNPDTYIIPEGGNNILGMNGGEEIANLIPEDYTQICVSVGTGTTFAGLRNALPRAQTLLGFVPMKSGNYLKESISENLNANKNQHWQLFDDFHFGGFGKWNEILIAFMNSFYKQNKISLDIVYTAKMMFGIKQLLQQNYFPEHAKILCIHTGGLQGNDSIKDQLIY